MDYSKYALALQLLQLAKPEIAAAITKKTGRTPVPNAPSDHLEAIVYDTLDELKDVLSYIDRWEDTHSPR